MWGFLRIYDKQRYAELCLFGFPLMWFEPWVFDGLCPCACFRSLFIMLAALCVDTAFDAIIAFVFDNRISIFYFLIISFYIYLRIYFYSCLFYYHCLYLLLFIINLLFHLFRWFSFTNQILITMNIHNDQRPLFSWDFWPNTFDLSRNNCNSTA